MLIADNLSYAYNADGPDAIVALKSISLTIAPGELVAIIGHNGSGKSTLARVLSAMIEPTEGSFSVDGVPGTAENVWEIRRLVGMVFQRPDDQLIANTVLDDVAFGPENLGLPREEIERRVQRVLDALSLRHVANSQISDLSGGEKQRVAIAGVLAMEPRYLILDEPTTMVSPRQARQMLALAAELRQRAGVAVLHITHFMHETVAFDRLIVMHAGQIVIDGPPREVFARAEELAGYGLTVPAVTRLGQHLRQRGVDLPPALLNVTEFAEALPPLAPATPALPRSPEESPTVETPLFAGRELNFTYMAGTPLAQVGLRGANFQILAGETIALLGGTQAGKSTLIEFLNGLRRPPAGQMWYQGEDIGAAKFPLSRLSDAVAVVFQQPESQLIEDIVGMDVSFAPRRKNLPPAESRAIVAEALNAVGLDYETFRLRYIYALSGGQKRRVALAGALAARPQVLVLDEPVAGLDPRGRAELATLIANLTQRDGLTVILVGAAIDELAELADRAIVMHEGQVVREGPLRDLLAHADDLHRMGLELSEAAEIARVLRQRWPDLPIDLLQLEELEAVLAERLGLAPSPSMAE